MAWKEIGYRSSWVQHVRARPGPGPRIHFGKGKELAYVRGKIHGDVFHPCAEPLPLPSPGTDKSSSLGTPDSPKLLQTLVQMEFDGHLPLVCPTWIRVERHVRRNKRAGMHIRSNVWKLPRVLQPLASEGSPEGSKQHAHSMPHYRITGRCGNNKHQPSASLIAG